MSIFPKRTLPGKTVTIHWNFNTASLKGTHIFPLVRIGVKDPLGNITMLFEEHVLALPDQKVIRDKNSRDLAYVQEFEGLFKYVPDLVLFHFVHVHEP